MGPASITLDPAHGTTFAVERDEAALHLTGSFRMHDAPAIWRELHRSAKDVTEPRLAIDLSGARAIDGAVMAMLGALRTELAARGVHAEVEGAPEHLQRLVELYGVDARPTSQKKRPTEGKVMRIGRVAIRTGAAFAGLIAFLGGLVLSAIALVKSRKSGHLKAVPALVERTGADALAFVAFINFLVGFVMANQASSQARGPLAVVGVSLYLADIVGLTLTRELTPLMTAIIVCGWSGAAFAAEIGAMKISGELDALRTLGLRPFDWLVVPRVLALVIVMPTLTIVGDVVGVLGGLAFGVTSKGLSAKGYLLETTHSVRFMDVGHGLIKSVVFAVAIGLITCRQGFATSGGAAGVGRHTTSSVVRSLFALVVLDALLTVIFHSLRI